MLFVGNQNSLRKQLLTFLMVSIALLSLTSSIVAAWIAVNQSRQVLEHHSLQIAGNLAHQSLLSLITESKENADQALDQAMAFNDVSGVAIFTERMSLLQQRGEISWDAEQLKDWFAHPVPVLAADNRDHWIITSPVFLREEQDDYDEFELSGSQEELMGYVMLNVSKDSLQTLTTNLFSYNLMIGLGFATLLVWLQSVGLKRITRPLLNLSQSMNEARTSGEHNYANVEGPMEVRQMAESYNAMMQVLEQQEDKLVKLNSGLETEVAIRTKELTHARDTALVAVRTQSEFLANISHELRTPLQATMGYIELVIEELEDEAMDEPVEDLREAMRASTRLLALINMILDLAKCESGKMELMPQEISLRTLTQETEAVIRPLASKRQNAFKVYLPAEDHLLQVDTEKAQQVLLNLLSNACKFTEQGTVLLSASVEDGFVIWQVSDTGIGIPKEQQGLIFDKFRQIDGSVKRKYGGTGLGLAISKHFTEMMGGTLDVFSETGQGTTFVFRLPLVAPADTVVQTSENLLSKKLSSTDLEKL